MFGFCMSLIDRCIKPVLYLILFSIVSAIRLYAHDRSALRFTGTATRISFGIDGKTPRIQSEGRFELDLDPSGRWLMTSYCDSAPKIRFCTGYDGTNTYEMECFLGDFAYEDDTNRIVSLTYETSTSLASIYSGNEFPFDLWPTDSFAWFIFASKSYQDDTNHLGRTGDLFKRLEIDPIRLALKVEPRFTSNWPPILEKAELFFDMRDYPSNHLGLALPSDEMQYKLVERLWSQLRARTSGVQVGTMTSAFLKDYGGHTLPSRYTLEMSWRGTSVPENSVGIDNLSERIILNLVDVKPVGTVVGRPEFVGPGVLVKDYRFRYVNSHSAMEYLGYNITDKKWKPFDDALLQAKAAHNRWYSPRFGNLKNQAVKTFGGVFLVAIFLVPLIFAIKNGKYF